MLSTSRFQRAPFSTAFTLVELVLTVALMLLLAGAVILSVGSLDKHSQLEEGALQLETLFRYARAQAANTGRQVRIVFSSESPVIPGADARTNSIASVPSTNLWVQMLWEPDPVRAPGRFESFRGADMLVEQINDLVRVQAVGQPGTFATNAASLSMTALSVPPPTDDTNGLASGESATNSIPPLSCYPDGSSDSMEVLLAPTDAEDPRLAVVTLEGLAGRTRHRILSASADGTSQSWDPTEDEESTNQ